MRSSKPNASTLHHQPAAAGFCNKQHACCGYSKPTAAGVCRCTCMYISPPRRAHSTFMRPLWRAHKPTEAGEHEAPARATIPAKSPPRRACNSITSPPRRALTSILEKPKISTTHDPGRTNCALRSVTAIINGHTQPLGDAREPAAAASRVQSNFCGTRPKRAKSVLISKSGGLVIFSSPPLYHVSRPRSWHMEGKLGKLRTFF